MKKLRLLLWKECNRNCEGCCNNDWDLENLEQETDYSQYDVIMLTGGEPMLRPDRVIRTVEMIRNKKAKIYLYTAEVSDVLSTLAVLRVVDGITVTLHTEDDVDAFESLDYIMDQFRYQLGDEDPLMEKSLRLNIFNGIGYVDSMCEWHIKDNMKWIKDCPLPKGEVFKKL